MNLPAGEIVVERTGEDEGGPWMQQEHIDLSEAQGHDDTPADWAAIKEALGVSSQAKAQNVAGYLLARILGI